MYFDKAVKKITIVSKINDITRFAIEIHGFFVQNILFNGTVIDWHLNLPMKYYRICVW
jgi:hypothetical protein